MTRSLGSCRSGSRGWRRTARAWTSALSGGTTNCIPEAARRPGTHCHPARGRKHLSFLAHTLSTCCRRSTSWKTGRPSKRPGQQCPLRREKQMAPDPVFTLRGSLEQLVPYTGLTFSAKAGGCQSYCSPLTLCQHWPGLFCCPWDRHSCGSEADLAKQDCYLQSLTSPPPPPPQCPPTKKMDFIQSGNPPDFQPYPQPLSQELGPTAGRTPKKKKKKKKFCRSLAHPSCRWRCSLPVFLRAIPGVCLQDSKDWNKTHPDSLT